MNLKTSGKYLARVLSFKATTFDIVHTGIDEKFIDQYDKATVSPITKDIIVTRPKGLWG